MKQVLKERKGKQSVAFQYLNVQDLVQAVNSDHVLKVLETVKLVFCLQITHLLNVQSLTLNYYMVDSKTFFTSSLVKISIK